MSIAPWSGAVIRFHMLKYGLALVLIFVGLKMAWLNDLWNGKLPIGWSLAVIGTLIGASLVLSLVMAPHTGTARSRPHPSPKRTHGHDAA